MKYVFCSFDCFISQSLVFVNKYLKLKGGGCEQRTKRSCTRLRRRLLPSIINHLRRVYTKSLTLKLKI